MNDGDLLHTIATQCVNYDNNAVLFQQQQQRTEYTFRRHQIVTKLTTNKYIISTTNQAT